MLKIKKRDHLETLVSSINKMFFIAKTKGIINNKELYLINLIYKLISAESFEFLKDSERMVLITLYYKIINKYSFLCKSELTRSYYFESISTNEVYTPDDCYAYPIYNKIFYWQEASYITTDDILIPIVDDTGYFNDKLSDTFANFELGKDIEYNNIGRVCFAIMEAEETSTYEIKDALGNNVTHTFDLTFIEQINTTLVVSQNIYSHGNMTFKIKKLT